MSKVQKQVIHICDQVAERVVISSLVNHGDEIFYEISALVDTNDFYFPENKLVFSSIKKLIEDGIKRPDVATIVHFIASLDSDAVNRFNLTDLLTSFIDSVLPEHIDPFLKIVKRLSILRNVKLKLQESLKVLDASDGSESITDIILKAEKPFSDFVNLINNQDDAIEFSDHFADYLDYLEKVKPTVQGVKSGYPIYDAVLGGGLISPGFHVLGARSGVGKSFFLLNVAKNVAENNIPTLILDTELTEKMQMDRLLALISGVKIDHIRNGSFATRPEEKNNINIALQKHKVLPISYNNISGKPYTEWLSLARKWILKTVGLNASGKAKQCLLIIDYLKLMSLGHTENFQEYQYLGQMATDLHNFCIQYDIPCLCAVQLNRDGISRDDQGVIAGSDRIVGLSTSCSLLKKKTSDDYTDDPEQNGNMKLVVVKSRFGPGTEESEYINIKANLSKGVMLEGSTNVENRRNR